MPNVAANTNPNTTYIVKEVQAGDGYVRRNFIDSPTDEVATSDDVLKSLLNNAILVTTSTCVFTITSGSATVGAVYSNNGQQFTVVATIASQVTLVTTQTGASAASGTLTKVSGTGDATITFSAANVIVQPDVPRVLSIISTSTDHDAAGVVTINGTDIRGGVISDAITLNGNTVVNGVKAFATVTSIDLTAVTALDTAAGVAVGRTDILGLDRCMSEDNGMHATLAGTRESTRPTFTYDPSVVSLNTVLLNSDLDGSSDVVVWFATKEQTTLENTTMPIA